MAEREAHDELRALAGELRRPGKHMRLAAGAARAVIAGALAGRRSPDGTPWDPRQAMTRKGGRLYRRSAPRSTGRLAASVSVEATEAELVIRAPVPYAGFVQEGTRRMPARPFLPIDAEGRPMEQGEGGQFWERFEEALADGPLAEVYGGR